MKILVDKAVIEQASKALESYSKSDYIKKQHPKRRANGEKAITALREALAEQAEQEPVAERFEKMHANGDVWITTLAAAAIARNAAPVRTKDLTDDEIDALVDSACDSQMPMDMFARAVIAADRRKNK